MYMKTFIKSVAIITVFAVITRLIGFLFRIVLARILGDEMLGVYQLALSFFTVFLTIVASGLPLAISKRVATGKVRGVVACGLVISLTVSVISCAVVMLLGDLFAPLFTDTRCVAILIALIPSMIAASVYCVTRAVWWGEKRFLLLGLTELMEQIVRVVTFAVMLAFAFLFVDMAQIAALSYTVAFVIAAAVVAVIFVKTRKLGHTTQDTRCGSHPRGSRPPQFKPIMKSTLPITGVRVVTSLTVPIISVLIIKRLVAGGWNTVEAISAFGILSGMTLPLLCIPQTIIGSLSTALVPELSSAHAKTQTDQIRRTIGNTMKFTLFINFLLIPVYIGIGAGIGLFVFDNRTSGVFLMQFAWAMLPMSISSITNAILNSLGAEARAMKHYFLGAIFMFACIWFLPKFIGIAAMVVGIGVCMTVAGTLNLLLIKKIAGASVALQTLLQILVFSALCVVPSIVGYFLYGILITWFGLFFTLAVCAVTIIAMFLTLCRLFNIIDISAITVAIKSKN